MVHTLISSSRAASSFDPQEAAQTADAFVKHYDLDRWLAARFIGTETKRQGVMVLSRLDQTLAQIAPQVSEAMMGEMRLTFWHEQIEALFMGKAAPGHGSGEHPLLRELRPLLETFPGLRQQGFSKIADLIDGRALDLSEAALLTAQGQKTYIEQVTVGLSRLWLLILEPDLALLDDWVPLARAYGLARLIGSGRVRDEDLGPLRHQVYALLKAGQAATRGMGFEAFSAMVPAALAMSMANGLAPGPLQRRLKLTMSMLTGRVL